MLKEQCDILFKAAVDIDAEMCGSRLLPQYQRSARLVAEQMWGGINDTPLESVQEGERCIDRLVNWMAQ